jgi:hypothetical protein
MIYSMQSLSLAHECNDDTQFGLKHRLERY